METFKQLESEVRSYLRSFPAVFETAQSSFMYDENGKRYIDFFAGAGSLNYGHNNPVINEAIIDYLERNGVVHGLDMATVAKRDFLRKFKETILLPRNLEYKVQFTGPTGTNAVEAALKLARIVKDRSSIIAFTNGYHGLTMGSLAVTGNSFYQEESFGLMSNTAFMPYDGYLGSDVDTIDYLRQHLEDGSSGMDLPAAVIVETIQAEGGINVASIEWLRQLELLCREFDILLIVDDIQAGNGRAGTFFSFECAEIVPDMVAVSKSVGNGMPMALLLIKPEIDQWQPGQHTGTFRGNNLAFVAATEALRYWENDSFPKSILNKGRIMEERLLEIAENCAESDFQVRGSGMIWGLDLIEEGAAEEVSKIAFQNGVLIETSGFEANVLKFLPPLTIEEKLLKVGLEIVGDAVKMALPAATNKRDATIAETHS